MKQLTLGELIIKLENQPRGNKVVIDFNNNMSPTRFQVYKRVNGNLSIDYCENKNLTVKDFLRQAKDSLEIIFPGPYGYQDGEYRMNKDTDIWVSKYGEYSGIVLIDVVAKNDNTILVTATEKEILADKESDYAMASFTRNAIYMPHGDVVLSLIDDNFTSVGLIRKLDNLANDLVQINEDNSYEKDCPFCNKKEYVLENELAFAIFDTYPVNKGHMLVIPKRHVHGYFEATKKEIDAIIRLIDEGKKLLDEKYSPDGYNIGFNYGEAAGQTVMHLHGHLIPRYKGDMEDPRGGVRGVIPDKQKY